MLELAILFLRLGVTAFGGPAAHIAMMDEEIVRRRKWLSHEEFLDLLGATNLIPGPNSTELAIHIGHRRAGWPGLLIAGVCFIFPAALITLALAWIYVRYGKIPQVTGVLYGVKPVMIAVVVQALHGLGRTALKTKPLVVIGALATVLTFLGVNELMLLFGSGALATMIMTMPRTPKKTAAFFFGGVTPSAAVLGAASSTSSSIFLVFAKIGSVLFGSGYVLIAFMREDLVERRHWMTEGQLLDAVAIGQITPGPVFTAATFAGYVMNGFAGAAAATIGIFLPAFVFVALSGLLLPKLRKSPRAGAFLDGVNVASLALMACVTFQLGRAALVDALTIVVALGSAALLIRWRVSSLWLILGGGVAGFVSTTMIR